MTTQDKINLLVLEKVFGNDAQKDCPTTIPDFYGDIVEAWKVIEKLNPSRLSLTYHREPPYWECRFGDGPVSVTPSAPAAITLAGLAAKGVDAQQLYEEWMVEFLLT